MRRWQLRKIREAGLSTYTTATWSQAQSEIAMAEAAHQRAEWERKQAQQSAPVISAQPAQQISAVIDAQPAKPRGGKVAKPCPYCGQEFKALHWHVDKCKMRPAA